MQLGMLSDLFVEKRACQLFEADKVVRDGQRVCWRQGNDKLPSADNLPFPTAYEQLSYGSVIRRKGWVNKYVMRFHGQDVVIDEEDRLTLFTGPSEDCNADDWLVV